MVLADITLALVDPRIRYGKNENSRFSRRARSAFPPCLVFSTCHGVRRRSRPMGRQPRFRETYHPPNLRLTLQGLQAQEARYQYHDLEVCAREGRVSSGRVLREGRAVQALRPHSAERHLIGTKDGTIRFLFGADNLSRDLSRAWSGSRISSPSGLSRRRSRRPRHFSAALPDITAAWSTGPSRLSFHADPGLYSSSFAPCFPAT